MLKGKLGLGGGGGVVLWGIVANQKYHSYDFCNGGIEHYM